MTSKTLADLAPKSKKPNCVSSVVSSGKAAIAPLSCNGDASAAWAALKGVIEAQPSMAIKAVDDRYMHATDTTKLVKFVDDVEFLLDGENIQVRSCSRVGYSDWGVNRKRVESIREQLAAKLA